MSHTITHYQEENRFGQNIDTLNVLKGLSEKKTETKQDFENLKKAIEKFNNIGIEIDVSIRFQAELFY